MSLLDNYDSMQSRPMGSLATSMRPPSAAGQMYRRQTEAYGQALRTLRRAGRCGDANASLKEIAVREDAMDRGYQVGGIRRSEEYRAGAGEFERTRGLGAQKIEDAINRSIEPAAPSYDTDRNNIPDMIQRPQDTVNPNATAGAGRGTPISRRTVEDMGAKNDIIQRHLEKQSVHPLVRGRQQFAQDLSRSKLLEDQDPAAMERAYRRGGTLGLSRDRVSSYLGI